MASWWLTLEDLHWPDYDVEARIERRAAQMAAGGVNVAVIFGLHFRWDFIPYFERINSLLGRITTECHRHGIKVVDHYSDTLTHRARNLEDRWYIRQRLDHHVPLYPDLGHEFRYAGSARDSWRTVDVRTGEPVYYEPYRCNVFCPNNPDYERASITYALSLFNEAGMDGLMDDDFVFYPGVYSCSCEHCRERFLKECGLRLPEATDTTFWGNTENPDFREWLAMRLRSVGDHFVHMRAALGPERPLFSCCSSTSSRGVSDLGLVYDDLVRGCNTVCMEMVTVAPLRECHQYFAHQMPYRAIAWAAGFLRGEVDHALNVASPDPLVSIAYAESPLQFFLCWALQKAWGHQSWVCRRTASRNDEEARKKHDDEAHMQEGTLIWEKEHEDLFRAARPVADVGIVFSPATRSFASKAQADEHEKAMMGWIQKVSASGILCDTILQQALQGRDAGKRLAERFKALVLPATVALADSEFEGLAAYVEHGGQLTLAGDCGSRDEKGQARPAAQTDAFLQSLGKGVLRLEAQVGDGTAVDKWIANLPSRLLIPDQDAEGWSFTLFERDDAIFLHLLNLSGLKLLPEGVSEAEVQFPRPASGRVVCRLNLRHVPVAARLFSPDGAEDVAVGIAAGDSYFELVIPLDACSRYGIVRVQCDTLHEHQWVDNPGKSPC